MMSELDLRSRFFMSDYQQNSLAINPPLDDSMGTNQVTTNSPPNFIQELQGGNILLPQVRSRDSPHSAPSVSSDWYAAWCSSDESFAFPGQFQSWDEQQPPGSNDWSAIDHRFLPVQDGNPVRSVEVF